MVTYRLSREGATRRRRRPAMLLAAVLLLVMSAMPAHATIIKNPPWADVFSAHYPNGTTLDTRASGTAADVQLDATGYFSTSSVTGTAAKSMNAVHAQADAVWAFFGHGAPGWAQFYDMGSGTWSDLTTSSLMGHGCAAPNDCVTDYAGDLTRMKIMVFGGCHTGVDALPGQSYQGSLLRAANSGAGVDVAVGFYNYIYWPAMDTWSDRFFLRLKNGDTTWDALISARNKVLVDHGQYYGTDEFVAMGDVNTKASPAAYGTN